MKKIRYTYTCVLGLCWGGVVMAAEASESELMDFRDEAVKTEAAIDSNESGDSIGYVTPPNSPASEAQKPAPLI